MKHNALSSLDAITDRIFSYRPPTSAIASKANSDFLNKIHAGDSRVVMREFPANSIDLSFWSPPYFVGKDYEAHLKFADWKKLLRGVIKEHARVMKGGAFMVININDILDRKSVV